MKKPPIALVPEDPDGEANEEAWEQAQDAGHSVVRLPTKFLHLPWPSLDHVVGGIAPGEVWFVGAYSGHGKTTFLMSALDAWHEQGKSVYYMGLESKPSVLRTQWACLRLGINAGEVLSGAMQTNAEWKFTRAQLVEELRKQTTGKVPSQVYFSPEKFVDQSRLQSAIAHARELKSDVLIIDHVDHLEGEGNLYNASVQVMRSLLSFAQDFGVKVLAATQFNNEMIRGNRLGMYLPPTPLAVYQGSHKRQIASGMLGLYRPLKFDITTDEMKRFQRGQLEPQKVVEPNAMAVSVMKHRLFGNREGRRIVLGVEKGRVVEDTQLASIATHGVPRRSL